MLFRTIFAQSIISESEKECRNIIRLLCCYDVLIIIKWDRSGAEDSGIDLSGGSRPT